MGQEATSGDVHLLTANKGDEATQTRDNVVDHASNPSLERLSEILVCQMKIAEELKSIANSINNNHEHKITISNTDVEPSPAINSESDAEKLARLRKMADTHMIVAALVATITFAAGFTMPGGYIGNIAPGFGLATNRKKPAFKVFVIADTIALAFSLIAISIYFSASSIISFEIVDKFTRIGTAFVKLSIHATLVAFITGIYVSLAPSHLAIAACVIGSILSYAVVMAIEFKTLREMEIDGQFAGSGSVAEILIKKVLKVYFGI